MIISKQGETFEYEGKKYIVGEYVYATESAYYGLIGVIKEIRTGKDVETENGAPDVYCDFYEPVLQADKDRINKAFGEYYALDGIIMAPSMITPIREGCCSGKEELGKVFLLQENWNFDGEGLQSNTMAFTNKESALMFLRYKLYIDAEEGSIAAYQGKDNMMVDEGAEDYEIYLEGFYNEDHYLIHIVEVSLATAESYYQALKEKVTKLSRRDDIIEQISQWEETLAMSEAQYSALINDETISERIKEGLSSEDEFWETYWRVVSEVAFDLIRKHTEKE